MNIEVGLKCTYMTTSGMHRLPFKSLYLVWSNFLKNIFYFYNYVIHW